MNQRGRFQFPLERVLHYKHQQERQGEMRLLQAQAALTRCEADIDSLRRQLQEFAALPQPPVGQPLDLAAWLARCRQAEQLGQVMREAETRLLQLRQAWLEALQYRNQLAKEVKVLDQLRSYQWQRHRRIQNRNDQILLDDLTLRRWQAGQGETERTP